MLLLDIIKCLIPMLRPSLASCKFGPQNSAGPFLSNTRGGDGLAEEGHDEGHHCIAMEVKNPSDDCGGIAHHQGDAPEVHPSFPPRENNPNSLTQKTEAS
jgi:hypothetical protein